MEEKLKLSSEVEKIIFESKESGFKVAIIEIDGDEQKITGIMPDLKEGSIYDFELENSIHDSYGFQFTVLSYKLSEPTTDLGIIKFLSSGAFKGIGAQNATYIVEKFGDKTLDILKNDIDKLLEVKGIGKKSLAKIKLSVEEHFEASETLYALNKMGFTLAQSKRIYDIFGTESEDVVIENPYRLLIEVKGLGFSTIDKIALENGFLSASPERIEALLLYEMSLITYGEGHLFIEEDILYKKILKNINLERKVFDESIENLIVLNQLVSQTYYEKKVLYLSNIFDWENDIIHHLIRLSLSYVRKASFENSKARIKLSEEQNEALRDAFKESIFILTGAAGTGKTTILKELIERARAAGLSTLHAAPTGRAASRMEELINYEASTIHRMLQYQFDEDESQLYFLKNESNPLDADVVFIDEASMIDVALFACLLRAIKNGTCLVLIGDPNQLPPVGPGLPFNDMIKSNIFNSKELKGIHRQAGESQILLNAHAILNEKNFIYNKKNGDFYHFYESSSKLSLQRVIELVSDRVPKVFGYEPLESMCVLSPLKKGILGVENLNKELQKKLNPLATSLYFNKFAAGDKVMQIKNNYNAEWINKSDSKGGKGVFNGEIGFVLSSSKTGLLVKFLDDKEIFYNPSNVRELDLAYAMTVHKSQGNEFDVVVFPSFYFPPVMQSKNLMYTALTRAKKLFVLVGQKEYFEIAARNSKNIERNTYLVEKLLLINQ